MRIATGILSLLFALFAFYQAGQPAPMDVTLSEHENFVGWTSFIGVFLVIGMAFVFKKPKISAVVYAVAGLIGILAGIGSTLVPNEVISYGVVSVIFSFMSLGGLKESPSTGNSQQNIDKDIEKLKLEIKLLELEKEKNEKTNQTNF